MDIRQADPDLESIARRISHAEIDLQPDFQRQEVWSKTKKQKLIDTILRGWAIPPIHLVQGSYSEEVLDGQQRLTAIRDFFLGKFPVNGAVPPVSDEVQALDGLYYNNLPGHVRRRFDRYTLRVYTVYEAHPQETAELFYRLNQPTALTSGEQRNALYGARRTQMKSIVFQMMRFGFDLRTIGFSNARLSYDDVIARALVILERGTLREKLGEAEISNAFRNEEPFSDDIVGRILSAAQQVSGAFQIKTLKLNKASLFSFLVAFARFPNSENEVFSSAINFLSKDSQTMSADSQIPDFYREVFLDRSSSRVTDVTSVVLRDFSIARCLSVSIGFPLSGLDSDIMHQARKLEANLDDWEVESELVELVLKSKWGVFI